MPRQGLGHSSVDIYNMVTPGADDPVWKHPGAGQLMVGYQQTRSNFVLFSQDATDTEAWTKTNTAIDSTLYEAPDNSTTANAIKSNTTGQKNYKITQSNLSVTAGKTYTVSVHFKKENLGFARLKWTGGTARRTDFNLTTGAVTNASQVLSTSVDAMDDGWFRCSMTFQADATETATLIAFAQSAAGDASPNIAVSDIVLIYVWGFQLEENSEMSAYIVTTNSAKTTTETLNDTSETWDFDSADLMPEADPDDDGVWEIPDNIVLNGDYEELGSELVASGTFSSFSKDFGDVTISGDTASFVNTGTNANSRVSLDGSSIVANKSYKIVFDVSRYVVGTVQIVLQGTTHSVDITGGVDTYTVYLLAGSSGDTKFRFKRNGSVGDFDFDVDNISIKQVDPNDRWTPGTGWTISDGKAHVDCTSTVGLTQSLSGLGIGNTYDVTITVSNYSAGTLQPQFAGVLATPTGVNTNGTHNFKITATASTMTFYLYALGTSEFTVDNVTVNEYAIQPQDV